MVKWFLLHEWKGRLRSTFWQKSVGINIILGLLGIYLALNVLALGFFLDVILEEAFPGRTALEVINQYLLYYLLIDLVMRFLLQQFPVFDLQRYMLLPVKKQKLFHYLLLKSIPTFFNVLPLFFIIPFSVKVLFSSYPGSVAVTWVALLLTFVLTNNFIAYYLKKTFSLRPLYVLGAFAVVAGLLILDIRGTLPLSQYFGNGIDAVLTQPALLLLPIAVLAGVYSFLFRVFGRYAYLDAQSNQRAKPVKEGQNFAVLSRLGKIGHIIQLDINLIRRNKRPRTMVMMVVIFLLYPFIFEDMMDQTGWMIFVGVIVTGMTMATYGQFLLSWESSFFDLYMGRNFSMRDYYEAKFFLFLGFISVCTTVSLLYGLLDWRLPVIFLAVALYNAGVNSFITMFFSTFNTKRMDPDRQAFFNYEGVGAGQFLYTIPLFLGPILIYWPFSAIGYPWVGLGAVGLLGVVGIIFKNQLLNRITRQFESRKYIITSGFKKPA